jgi:ribosomal protein L30/L7E
MAPGPYRTVGNVIIVRCIDHPFKHFWEVNKELRDLRLEFKGQTTVVPDTPFFRKKLWRVRHVVKLDMMDLDEVRSLIGVPSHIKFQELRQQIPLNFGRGRGRRSPFSRSRVNFHALRSQRLRDILERDAVEKRLLAKKKELRAAQNKQ